MALNGDYKSASAVDMCLSLILAEVPQELDMQNKTSASYIVFRLWDIHKLMRLNRYIPSGVLLCVFYKRLNDFFVLTPFGLQV